MRSQLVGQAPELVERASVSSVDWFERHVRDLARRLSADDGLRQRERVHRQRFLHRWSDRQTGLCHTHLAVDPETDARITAVLDAAIAAERATPDPEHRSFDHLRVDAFVAAFTGPRTREQRRPAEVSVLIDTATLTGGSHERTVCETFDGQPIPPESVRRIACDASDHPDRRRRRRSSCWTTAHGRRMATVEQRRALRAMYRSCGFPDCTVRFGDCEVHHVVEWVQHRGRPTSTTCCRSVSEHHHLVHEGGWHLELFPRPRASSCAAPTGGVLFDGSTVDVAPDGTARVA